jgi:ribosomal protein S18 acetylase RimI-like enzyme
LHINLLPEARGTGLGALLMKQWQDHLRQAGVPGCHLGTIAENTRAIGFFERMGFEKYGRPVLIPGLRGPVGEWLHEQLMVWST